MTATPDTDAREAFVERLVEDTTRSLETLSVYLGLKLGLYRALADLGTATVTDVAARAGVAPTSAATACLRRTRRSCSMRTARFTPVPPQGCSLAWPACCHNS